LYKNILFNNIINRQISFLELVLQKTTEMGQYFKYRSGRIHYSDNGSGKIIVLLHGYLETSEVWAGFANKLVKKFRVITVDLPGHGYSDIFGESHSMEFMATVLREIIRSLNIERIFLTGHSLGGYVALAFMELYPEMLSGYCLFHSHPFADSEEALEKRDREIKLVLAGKKDLMYPENVKKMFANINLDKFHDSLERSKMIASSIPGEGIIAVLRGMMKRPSRISVMEEGKVPCLWILGAMDNHIDCELVQTRVRLPENAEIAILKNSGHMGFIEEEERSLKIMAEFVKNCS
jgi:pimeloyl-ACP methyl ester carboxylesterase